MKTHDLANEMMSLAKVLKKGPNIDLSKIPDLLGNGAGLENDEMAFGISTLTHLSKFSKQEWITFIQEHKLPISYTPRDSARNLIGKIMNYLEVNEEALTRVSEAAKSGKSGSSEKLNRAFGILMNR